jgi:uncharacterized integral membrane protein
MISIIMIILIILFLLFVVLCSTVTIKVHYEYVQNQDCLKIKALIWKKVSIYKLEVPLIKVEYDEPSVKIKTKKESPLGNKKNTTEKLTPEKVSESTDKFFNNILIRIDELYGIVGDFIEKVHVSNFKWHSDIGLGDAALTGIVTGCVWSVKGGVVGIIGNKMILDDEPNLSIQPLYQMNMAQTNLSCMISFKVGNAILVALRVVKHWKGR